MRATILAMVDVLVPAIFGLILGSFANVLILREEKGEGIGGRSRCPCCHRTLRWYELVPVLSFIVLRGKCRTCNATISWQYPLVESIVALGVVAVWLAPVPLFHKALGVPTVLLLVCIAVYDLRTTYIPDRWAYIFAVLAFGSGIPQLLYAPAADIIRFLFAGPAIALPLAALWAISGGRWMGLGDAKLVLGFGWLLGMVHGFLALGLAFVLGALVGALLIGITRLGKGTAGFTMQSEVPFGPFLILSLCIVWFSQLYGIDILGFLVRFLSLS